jgi:hypothetical protein
VRPYTRNRTHALYKVLSIRNDDGRWYLCPGNGLFALVQRRVRKTRSWDIDYKPERLPKRSDARIDCERVRCTRKQVPDTGAIALPMHEGI